MARITVRLVGADGQQIASAYLMDDDVRRDGRRTINAGEAARIRSSFDNIPSDATIRISGSSLSPSALSLSAGQEIFFNGSRVPSNLLGTPPADGGDGDGDGDGNGGGGDTGGRRGGGTRRPRRSTPPTPGAAYPIFIKVGDGEWVEIRGDDANRELNSAEAGRLITALGDSPGNMTDNVEIRYNQQTSTTGRDTMTLGALYDTAGVTRPGASEEVGTATLRYRTSRNGSWQTDTISYRLQPDTEGRIGNAEARALRAAVRQRRRDASNGNDWQQIEVTAEGQTLNMGGLGDRVRIGNLSDEQVLANGIVARSLEEQKEELHERLIALKRMLRELLLFITSSGLDIQWLIRVKRLMNTIMQTQTALASVSAVEQMIEIQEKVDELTQEITELNSEARGFTGRLQAKTSEQQQLQGQLSGIMSYLRQAKSFDDEGVADLKSLQDSTHSRQVSNASWRD